jgi:hypothetical protein
LDSVEALVDHSGRIRANQLMLRVLDRARQRHVMPTGHGTTDFVNTHAGRSGRVIGAKAIATLLVGLGSMVVAFAVGALGNVAGSALAGVDSVWDISLSRAIHLSRLDWRGADRSPARWGAVPAVAG